MSDGCDDGRAASRYASVKPTSGTLMCESPLHSDADGASKAGAGDATLEDGYALLGDRRFGCIAQNRDRIAERSVDGDPTWRRNDRVTSGHVPSHDTVPWSDADCHSHAQARVFGLFAELLDVDLSTANTTPSSASIAAAVSYHLGETLGADINTQSVRIDIFRRTPRPVGAE